MIQYWPTLKINKINSEAKATAFKPWRVLLMIMPKHINSLIAIILLATTHQSKPISKHIIQGGIIASVIAAEAAVLFVARHGFMLHENAFGFKLGLLMGADVNHLFEQKFELENGKLYAKRIRFNDKKIILARLTPLMIAAIENKEKLTDKLIAHKADVNVQENQFGYTALHFALLNKHMRIATKLMLAGAKDVAAKDGTTPFMLYIINEIKGEDIQNPKEGSPLLPREVMRKISPEKREALGKQLNETLEKERIHQGL